MKVIDGYFINEIEAEKIRQMANNYSNCMICERCGSREEEKEINNEVDEILRMFK